MFNHPVSAADVRRVAIVGSGLSGLTAGLELKALGLDVTLYEKARGPGGRLASKRLPDGSADIGAQYFTAREPQFLPFIDRHAGSEHYQLWQARLGYQKEDLSWEAFRPEKRYVGVPRMTAVTRALSESLNILFETRIARLERETGKNAWQLMDNQGHSHGPFDLVLVTTPPAQAEEILAASGLEDLAHTFIEETTSMRACWTVVAHFPEPPETGGKDGLQPRDSRLQWAANDSSKPGRRSPQQGSGEWWVLHGRPDWSEQHRDADHQFVMDSLLQAFAEYAPCAVAPDQRLAHRWLYARSDRPPGPGHLWFPEQRIAVLGDWLQGGRVEGAWKSAHGFIQQLIAEVRLAPAGPDAGRSG